LPGQSAPISQAPIEHDSCHDRFRQASDGLLRCYPCALYAHTCALYAHSKSMLLLWCEHGHQRQCLSCGLSACVSVTDITLVLYALAVYLAGRRRARTRRELWVLYVWCCVKCLGHLSSTSCQGFSPQGAGSGPQGPEQLVTSYICLIVVPSSHRIPHNPQSAFISAI
jgi:hypothetical protein